MKKKLVLWSAFALIAISFLIYFYSFTTTDSENLYLSVYDGNDSGWEISGIENGKEIPLTPAQAVQHGETVFLRGTATEDWANYSRINVDTGRAVLVFVDDSLVFANHETALSKPGEVSLMQKPADQPYSLVFSLNPVWIGKSVTVVTRLYENEPYGSIGFELVSDNVFMLQHEAWVNQKSLPGVMFGVLSLLLLGLFLFEFSSKKKGFPLLFLAFSALLQMLCYMSVLSENPFPMIDSGIAMALYSLFPLLYLGTKLTHCKKRYFIAVLCAWGIYFALYTVTFVLYLPVPYWFDRLEVLCLALPIIMLYFCFKERRTNPLIKHFVSLLAMLCAGWFLLFLVASALHIPISQTIWVIFNEAVNLYFRPILFWVFTTVLIALFILAVWDLLQERVDAAKQMEHLQSEQTILSLQIGAAKDQLASLRVTNEQTATYRHDMRHHILLIGGYLAEGSTDKIRDYLTQVQGNIDALSPLRFCENETVNLILSFFADKAKKAGVSFTVEVELPGRLALPETELCAILSNGLENAIAAASLVKQGDKTVRVNCRLDENKLLIFIQNAYMGKVALVNGLPKTEQEGHGFGTKSMAAIAEKRNGYFACEAEDGKFTLRVVLPLDGQQENED